MADISNEIKAFREAIYGEEVRGSMISLAEKVNVESTNAKTEAEKAAGSAASAASFANTAIERANAAAENTNTATKNIQDRADQGDFTGTIQIGKVTTGEAGAMASVKNTGTAKDAVFDIIIPRGDTGASLRLCGKWEPGAEYVNDTEYIDLVTYAGSLYGCLASHTSSEIIQPTDAGYWICIAEKGDTGDMENIETVKIPFEPAKERENIDTDDIFSVILGKISKWFSDITSGAGSTLLGDNLDQSRVLVSDESGKVSVSSITSTILGYLSGLKRDVQEQLDEKINSSKVVQSTNITEPGFIMDGMNASEKFAELSDAIDSDMNRTQLYPYTRSDGGIFTDILEIGDGALGTKSKNFCVYQSEARGWFTNMPKKVTEKEFVGFREVMYRDKDYYAIRLKETYPILGREWIALHTSNGWTDWGCTNGGRDTTILSVTWNGVNIRIYGNSERAFIWMYGQTTETVKTTGAAVTIANVSNANYRPRNTHVAYFIASIMWRVMFQYATSGNINIGYTYDMKNQISADLPAGITLYYFGVVAFEAPA